MGAWQYVLNLIDWCRIALDYWKVLV